MFRGFVLNPIDLIELNLKSLIGGNVYYQRKSYTYIIFATHIILISIICNPTKVGETSSQW